jgi:outer membrane protein assembly factor BamD (BamD/ComL family)
MDSFYKFATGEDSINENIKPPRHNLEQLNVKYAPMGFEIKRANRFFALYENGKLLAYVVYLRGIVGILDRLITAQKNADERINHLSGRLDGALKNQSRPDLSHLQKSVMSQ